LKERSSAFLSERVMTRDESSTDFTTPRTEWLAVFFADDDLAGEAAFDCRGVVANAKGAAAMNPNNVNAAIV
jgi:hypothetical protein